MQKQQIQQLVKECSMGLFDLACSVSGHSSWDLNLPVGVIDARRNRPKLMVTAVGTINSMVRASSTIGHPLMRQFFERMESVGLDKALEESIGGEQADDFAEIWQAYKQERFENGAPMWSIEDATAFVLQTKDAHQDHEVACIAILPGEPHSIATFSVPIAFLKHV